MSVATAVEQQSVTTQDIARSAETLRDTVISDKDKVEALAQEANAVSKASTSMAQSIAHFK
ncbi:hypothetical protein [Colwellia echini]|uniref:Methyl-accepting chemotaxis protein n=1 Tax=Colwellia echini TaxID=1982103 RepID=A0ABY3MV94_9GAMM|nr:hypothetical protein [Colwellia echini]TYK65115.1 hypothetical protein CWS31_012550 [Colwellia echini]